MKLFLLRHAESVANVNKIVCGQKNVELTLKGKEQALKVRSIFGDEVFYFDHAYCSPLIRAKMTAQLAFPELGFIYHDELMETDTGDFSHLTFDEMYRIEPRFRFQGKYSDLSYPNGESISQVMGRHISWLDRYILSFKKTNKNILIVGHAGTINCIVHHLLRIPLDIYPALRPSNCSVVRLLINEDFSQLVSMS